MRVSSQQLGWEHARRTHDCYASAHLTDPAGHTRALDLVTGLLYAWDARSLLDVGTGTGRVLKHFQGKVPHVKLAGVEPVPEFIEVAERSGVRPGTILEADGLALPYPDASWDVVTAFGVLHHVQQPELMIAEMLRVARRAVVISDANRFGHGTRLARYAKLVLTVSGLWPAWIFVCTLGKGYFVSESDGVFFSYSVFDAMQQLRDQSQNLLTFEMEKSLTATGPWSLGLLNSTSLLVAAVK